MKKYILLLIIFFSFSSCTNEIKYKAIQRIKKVNYRDSIINIIKESEGFSSKSYKCPAGYYTKGYGRITNDTNPISEIEATEYIKEDLLYRIQYTQQLYTGCDSLQLYTMAWVLYAYKNSIYRSKLLDSIYNYKINYLKQFVFYTDSTGNPIKSNHLEKTTNKIIKLWQQRQLLQ
jgi:hypothetical protein